MLTRTSFGAERELEGLTAVSLQPPHAGEERLSLGHLDAVRAEAATWTASARSTADAAPLRASSEPDRRVRREASRRQMMVGPSVDASDSSGPG